MRVLRLQRIRDREDEAERMREIRVRELGENISTFETKVGFIFLFFF